MRSARERVQRFSFLERNTSVSRLALLCLDENTPNRKTESIGGAIQSSCSHAQRELELPRVSAMRTARVNDNAGVYKFSQPLPSSLT